MVGVPRSKGCARCRQRRKGCDLKRPSCGGCEAAGVVCQGYERRPIFVNSFTGDTLDAKLTAARYKPDDLNSETSEFEAVTTLPSKYRGSTSPSQGLAVSAPSSLSGTANASQLIASFMREYLPGGKPAINLDSWIEIIPSMPASDKMAHQALLAISLCAAGRREDDPTLMRKGLDVYGAALLQASRAVQDPEMAKSTSLLAATKTFGMIEMLYGAGQDENLLPVRKWIGHLDGQVAITLLRKPEDFQTGIEHRLFVGSRYSLLISCFQHRKRFLLNTYEWRNIPWLVHPKTQKDLLVDILADMADLLCDVEEMKRNPGSPGSKFSPDALLGRLWHLEDELQNWVLQAGPLRILNNEQDEEEPSMGRKDFATADLTLFYWSCRLLLCFIIRQIVPSGANLPPSVRPSTYIQKIAKAIPYFFQPETGIMGSHRAAFPLGVCLQVLRTDSNSDPADVHAIMSLWEQPRIKGMLGKFMAGVMKDAVTRDASSDYANSMDKVHQHNASIMSQFEVNPYK